MDLVWLYKNIVANKQLTNHKTPTEPNSYAPPKIALIIFSGIKPLRIRSIK